MGAYEEFTLGRRESSRRRACLLIEAGSWVVVGLSGSHGKRRIVSWDERPDVDVVSSNWRQDKSHSVCH